MEDDSNDSSNIFAEWKKLIENRQVEDVHITTFQSWMEHSKKERFINWKDASIEDGNTMLNCAAYCNRLDLAKLLLDYGADINLTDAKFGNTALMHAAWRGNAQMAELLVAYGADINFVADTVGNTALILASWKGYFKIVALLLDNGADISMANDIGTTPLMMAAKKGQPETVQLLLDRGANMIIANDDGETALSVASDEGHTEIAKLLLAKLEADPNMCNSSGQTMLHLACRHDKRSSARQLLEIGADKDKIDDNGHTPLFYAAEKGFSDMVELLLVHSADADKADERRIRKHGSRSFYVVKGGRTPLFIAAQNGHQNVVALLLQHRADPYLCNNESQIPRDVSAVHVPIQKLFQIKDFFDIREQGNAFEPRFIPSIENYWYCVTEKNAFPPRLEDILHDIVKYPHFANKFLELYQENRDIVNWLDDDGRTVRQIACKECREAILFLGQYDLDDQPMYESPTCKIYSALDYGDRDEPPLKEPRRVAMKFMEEKQHFLNEMGSRRNSAGSPRFSSDFVTPYLATYRADLNPIYAVACKTWKKIGSETDVLPDYCLVMPLAERSLMEAMNSENLSAEHKDLTRREILLKLSKIFSYLHDMGYVHGDIKPHNVVRHMDGNVSWKSIDFDACAKVGDVIGIKLTTGSEMLTTVKAEDVDKETTKVILRKPGSGLDESELLLANPSFDVWSYGILMYQLVTGRSFLHCDLQGNVDDSGLQELANLTQRRIHEKLEGVTDVDARVLLSRILRLDPKERPTMSNIGQDSYFDPSESPQGRKAEFFRKRASVASVSQGLDERSEIEPPAASERIAGRDLSNVDDIERFLTTKSELSYFKLRDEDKDWNDKLLNSEVETFRFDQLGGMGEKPTLVDGDLIYGNTFLRGLLSSKGPDYSMGFLIEYFELYKIMDDAHEVCQGIKANLVSDVKSLKGIFSKLFIRGKALNDVVRGTLFCNNFDQFKYVGRQLEERYGHHVYIKPPKDEVGAWPIPKLLIYSNRRLYGRSMTVEIQFSTVYMHLATLASNNHLVYEAIRESTGYLDDKDKGFREFLQSLNAQYIDTEGLLRNQSAEEGHFEILVDNDGGNATTIEEKNTATIATGFIPSGRICCGELQFRFMPPTDRFQRFSESSFVVNNNLTLLSSHSYWSEEAYTLEGGKIVEFVVSFKGRGLVIAGIGTAKCMHGQTKSGERDGDRCSLHVGRSKFVVRKSGVEEVHRERKLPNQARAKITFKVLQDGIVSVSFVGKSNEEDTTEEILETSEVCMPTFRKRYYLYMRAPPGVHDVKFHQVGIR